MGGVYKSDSLERNIDIGDFPEINKGDPHFVWKDN